MTVYQRLLIVAVLLQVLVAAVVLFAGDMIPWLSLTVLALLVVSARRVAPRLMVEVAFSDRCVDDRQRP